MASECFFNQQTSDLLQHIAVFFEVAAIFLVWHDYKIRNSDLEKKGSGTALMGFGLAAPHNKRYKELTFALIIGCVAIFMELYQLASQYLAC